MAESNEGEKKYVNILLLGERGNGKSTLVNSFANYARFGTLKDAEDAPKFACLVRTQIIGSTADGEPHILESMTSNPTLHEFGNCATQEVTAYEIPYKGHIMRLIDTPGITSTTIEDYASCAKILEFITSLQHVHGVCVLLKPDLARITPDFMYSLLMYITRLGKPAAANIIFLFTRTRRSNYTALDTITCMMPILKDIATRQGFVIPLRYRKAEHKNCFYFDNECFNYLVACEQKVPMKASRACLEESWSVSQDSMLGLMNYLVGDSKNQPLPPYVLPNIEMIEMVRLSIFEMMIPLIDVAELIATNIDLHHIKIKSMGKEGTQLPYDQVLLVKGLEMIPLETAVATCVKCRIDCTLLNVQENLTSHDQRKRKMRDTCESCRCESTAHLLRYYRTRQVDTGAKKNFVLYTDYVEEYRLIIKCLATFAGFFYQHSSKAIANTYNVYLTTRITAENCGKGTNHAYVRRYKALLEEYRNASERISAEQRRSAEQIFSYIEDLKAMPLSGREITRLHNLCCSSQEEEIPMDVDDQEVEQPLITPEPSPEPVITPKDSEVRSTPFIALISDDEKKRIAIKLIQENNIKDAIKALQDLIFESDCSKMEPIQDASIDNVSLKHEEDPRTENQSETEPVFFDAVQDHTTAVYDPVQPNNNVPGIYGCTQGGAPRGGWHVYYQPGMGQFTLMNNIPNTNLQPGGFPENGTYYGIDNLQIHQTEGIYQSRVGMYDSNQRLYPNIAAMQSGEHGNNSGQVSRMTSKSEPQSESMPKPHLSTTGESSKSGNLSSSASVPSENTSASYAQKAAKSGKTSATQQMSARNQVHQQCQVQPVYHKSVETPKNKGQGNNSKRQKGKNKSRDNSTQDSDGNRKNKQSPGFLSGFWPFHK